MATSGVEKLLDWFEENDPDRLAEMDEAESIVQWLDGYFGVRYCSDAKSGQGICDFFLEAASLRSCPKPTKPPPNIPPEVHNQRPVDGSVCMDAVRMMCKGER